MSKLVDKERLAKLAKALDERAKAAVKAENERALAAEEAIEGKADANTAAIAAINNAETGILAQAKADAKAKDDAVRADFKAKDDELAGKIEALEGKFEGGEGSVSSQIAEAVGVEKERAEAKEAELLQAITKEVEDRGKAVKDLSDKHDQEMEAAANKVAEDLAALKLELQGEIDSDVLVEKNRAEGEEARIEAAYKAADTALHTTISAEIDADVKAAVDAQKLVDQAQNQKIADLESLMGLGGDEGQKTALEEIREGIAELVEKDTALQGEIDAVEADVAQVKSDFAAADATNLQAAKDYADQQITALVDSAPEAMDTLKELAEAISANQGIYDAYVAEHATAMANMKKDLQDKIDTDVKVVADELAKQKDAKQEGTLAHQIAAVEEFVEGHSHEGLQGEIDAVEDRVEALEAFKDGHSHEGLQGEINAVEGRCDTLEAFVKAHDHSVMEKGIADNKAAIEAEVGKEGVQGARDAAIATAIEKEVEDRDAAIEEALKTYSTTDEMKAVIGNVVSSLALTMENDKVVLKLGGKDGIAVTEVDLDLATDTDIDAIIAGLDVVEGK